MSFEGASDPLSLWLSSLKAFYGAVDWDEWWIQAIVSFHVVVFMLIVLTRKSQSVQIALTVSLCALGLCLQPLNSMGAQHWREFSRQNYFDANGVFIGSVVGLPCIVNLLILLTFFLVRMATMMAKVKAMQLKAAAKAKSKTQ